MNLITVKDFGIALNISGGTIRSKKSRGQLRCNKQGFIDINDSVNFAYIIEVNGGDLSVFDAYLIKQTTKSKVVKKNITTTKSKEIFENKKKDTISVEKTENTKEENPSVDGVSVKVAPTVETTKKVVENRLSASEKKAISARENYNRTLLDLDLRQKIAKVEREERESELKLMELEKKTGNIIPLDLATNLYQANNKAMLKSFESQIKNIAIVISAELGGTADDVNRIFRKLEGIPNKIIKSANSNVSREIDIILDEYSQINLINKR